MHDWLETLRRVRAHVRYAVRRASCSRQATALQHAVLQRRGLPATAGAADGIAHIRPHTPELF